MRSKFVGALALSAMAAWACGDSTAVTVDEIQGTWVATAFVFTSVADPTLSVDLITVGGGLSLTVRADSTFTATMIEPGAAPDVLQGTVVAGGSQLTISETGEGTPTVFSVARSGNEMVLTDTDEEFDFDLDGSDEPATLRIVMLRQ